MATTQSDAAGGELQLLRGLKAALLEEAQAESLLQSAVRHTLTQPVSLKKLPMIATIVQDIQDERILVLALEALGNAVALNQEALDADAILRLCLKIISRTENTEIWTQTLRLVSLVVGDLVSPPVALVSLCTEIVSSCDSPSSLLTYAVEVRRHFPVDAETVTNFRSRLEEALACPVSADSSALVVALIRAFDWLDISVSPDLRSRSLAALVDQHKLLISGSCVPNQTAPITSCPFSRQSQDVHAFSL